MQVRSITYFCHCGSPVNRLMLEKAGIFCRHARQLLEDAGFTVQTVRLAITPFSALVSPADATGFARQLRAEAHAQGFNYLSLGTVPSQEHAHFDVIPQLLKTSDDIFASVLMTHHNEVDLQAVRACAKIIHQCAGLDANGFGNLRFAALANVPAFAPFFPAAYAQGFAPSFALALEAADLAVQAFSSANSLDAARGNLIGSIEQQAQTLQGIADKLENIYQISFNGLDFTPAPFPEQQRSIGFALEALGLPAFGLSGSLAAAAFLTDALDRANFKRCGFNGLMLPVLEDATLAQRAIQNTLDVQTLLLYSAVCGTGLDTIPLPGDTSVEQLYAILLDLCALALRLNKPLTARLMPIPGKKAGEMTTFDFAFFANSRILPVSAQPLTGLLAGEGKLTISPRTKHT